MRGPLHPIVSEAVGAYLEEVDLALPGVVEDVYVTGSGAMGDFRPEISDVDLVAVTSEGLDDPQLDSLAAVHHPSRPDVDVLYVSRHELLDDPRRLSSPHSFGGKFHRDGAFAANPVTWRDLQTTAVAVRGTELTDKDIWFDPCILRQWNCENLDRYWRRQVDHWRQVEPIEARLRHQYGLQWLVLGVPRLHYTIATLQVTSKTGAGRHALGVVDDKWHPVIETAMALRTNREAPLPLSNEEARRQAVDLSDWLTEDAHRLIDG